MSFGGILFTNRGRNLQAKAQTGTAIQFTRIAIGDGYLGGSSIADLIALKNQVKTLAINKLKPLADGKAVVGTSFSNQDLVSGFYYREVGLFATDPDLGEILYAYGNAGDNAEYIPAGGGPDILEKQVDLISIIGNAQNVSAAINESLVFASKQELDELKNVTPVWGGTTTHAGNVYSIAQPVIASLVEGMAVSFKVDADSTGAVSLNWDGKGAKAVLKSTGAAITNWKAGGIYTVRYGGTDFTLQGEGGEYGTAGPAETLSGYTVGTEIGIENGTLALTGDAGTGDVLAGKTFYNNNAKSKGTGTMPNRGSVGTITLTTEGAEYTISAGAHNGLGKVRVAISNLIASVLKAGSVVGGITGTFTADATALANQMLSGVTAYVNGLKVTGTIPSKGAATITPGTANQTIAAGLFLSGVQTILGDANLLSSKILKGTTIFNVPGSAIDGSNMKKYATGQMNVSTGYYTVTGLTFRPRIIWIKNDSNIYSGLVVNTDQHPLAAVLNGNVYKETTITDSSFSIYNNIMSGSTTWYAFE